MELDQLRHFLSVAEHGNFTRAADAVLISQPALSRSIARLEEELGQPLFERQTRQISLTDAGQILMSRAQQILGMVDDVKCEITDDGQTGNVRVAAIPTIAPYFLPQLLREFASRFPQATSIVLEETTDVLLKRLSDGDIDLAIMAKPLSAKYLEIEELYTEELLLVIAPENPLATQKQIQLADLEKHPFILLGEAHCLTGNIIQFCEQKAIHPVNVEKTSQLASIQELVSLDHGVSLIPAMARALDQSEHRVYRSLSGTRPSRDLVMVWNPYRYQSRLLNSFKEFVREYINSIPTSMTGDSGN